MWRHKPIISITFIESDRGCNTYAYGTRAGVVRMTKDGGTTSSDLDPTKTLPGRRAVDEGRLRIQPTPNRAFVAVSFYDAGTPTTPGHIFRTENALSSSPTWTRVGPPDQPFADMPFNHHNAMNPRNTQLVLRGQRSDDGLWQSIDGGTTLDEARPRAGSCRPRLCTTFRSIRRRIRQLACDCRDVIP